jgi:hypothetical protein
MVCGKIVERSPGGQKIQLRQKYCSRECYVIGRERKRIKKQPLPLPCRICGKPVLYEKLGTFNVARRNGRAYHEACRKAFLSDLSSRTMRETNIRRRAFLSERMKTNNPMSDPEMRKKISAMFKGRPFKARGGNGQFTVPQRLLANSLGLPMEWPISTRPVSGKFPSIPSSYKADLADPSVRLAIEVDGRMHANRKWKILDAKKTEVLTSLGWSVLRFTNAEVNTDLSGCLLKIQSTISKLKETRTIS